MKVNKETIEKMAHLSRLYFDKKDEAKMLKSMNEILSWVEKLGEVDTDGVDPLTHMTVEINRMRDDRAEEPLPREKALVNAPAHNEEFFEVPRVIE
jgi:aspartyl-tRNA(Asn)/glutamyl-tRNA(Gln) amidotransferase subunit C